MCEYYCIGFMNDMLARKTFKKWWYNSKLFYYKCLKITQRSSDECNSTECNCYETQNIYPNWEVPLSNQPQFRLNKINEIKDYFVAEIKEWEPMSKRLSRYIASFDYLDNLLTVLSVTTVIISIVTVIGAAVGMASAGFSFLDFWFLQES